MVQLSHLYTTTGKNIALTIQTFVGKVMSLLHNMLCRFIIAFLLRNKHLLKSQSAVILESKKVKSSTVSISICPEVIRPDAMILVFWMLSFKPAFSLFSFTFIRRLFSSSLLSAISVVSSAYLRLLFLPAVLILGCDSSSLVFHLICSAKAGWQPYYTPFPIWNQSIVLCLVLTIASWSAYRFLRRQVKWSGISIPLRIFHILLWSTQSKALA